MSVISSSEQTRILAQIATIEAQIDAANTALTNIITSEIEEYRFDSGEGSQRAKQHEILKFESLIDRLERQRNYLNRKLTGGTNRVMNVRRKNGYDYYGRN